MKNILSSAFQYGIRVVGIDLVLIAIVCAALALIEHSLRSFGDWLFWAGVITMVVGLLSMVGSQSISGSSSYAVGKTVSEQSSVSQVNADLREEGRGFSFLLLAAGAGILAALISQLF